MIDGALLGAVTGECIHFAERQALENLRHELALRSEIFEIEHAINGEKELFRSLAKAMAFPDYFGGNWDAVDEALREIEPAMGRGIVLIVQHAETLWTKHPRLAGLLVETWLGAAEDWRRDNTPFHLLFLW